MHQNTLGGSCVGRSQCWTACSMPTHCDAMPDCFKSALHGQCACKAVLSASLHQHLYCPCQAAHLSLHRSVPAGKYVMEGGKVVGDCAVTVNGRRQPWEKHGEVGAMQAWLGQCQEHTLLWLCMLAWCCEHALLPCCPAASGPAQHHCVALVQVLIKFFMLPSDFKHERAFFNGFVYSSFVPGMPASLRDSPWRPLMQHVDWQPHP